MNIVLECSNWDFMRINIESLFLCMFMLLNLLNLCKHYYELVELFSKISICMLCCSVQLMYANFYKGLIEVFMKALTINYLNDQSKLAAEQS